MDEKGEAVPPGIGADEARRCVDAYVAAWNEPRADRRAQLLHQTLTADAAYVDPAKQMDHAGLVKHIGEVLEQHPGRRIVRTSAVDVHHRVCRFDWRLVLADGSQGAESVDFVEFARDGRMRRVTGFFGPPPPGP